MEILLNLPNGRPQLKAALFDFDGTISTLRYGWEEIMEPLMLEMIAGSSTSDEELIKEIRGYIDQSTGIQTIHQMKWLVDMVKRYGKNPDAPEDPWWYKKEYNRRLMEPVQWRKNSLLHNEKTAEDFLIRGSREILGALKEKGIEIYVASGTDDPDVKKEAEALGVTEFFKEIAGAPEGRTDCSKEAVLRRLIEEKGLNGYEVVVIGDGKVEIALGREVGAITLGVASNELERCGVSSIKRERLVKARAHAIVGDFEKAGEILAWLALC